MEFIDTHAHLDEAQFAGDLDEVLAAAASVGVRRVVNIGFSPERWRTTAALADRHEAVWCSFGLHPGNVMEGNDATLDELGRYLAHTKAVALGEIGLDYYWTTETKAVQLRWFERQLELANQLDLPVIIHQREAGDDVAAVLRGAPTSLTVILHSFDGAPALSALAEERGYFLGVGGLSTRRSAGDLRELLRATPLTRLLLETDAPYLTPTGVNAKRNVPGNVPVIAERLAALKQSSLEEVASVTGDNALRAFSRLGSAVR